ncbi:hypothetical protein D3C85_1130620 [compost metagenome]
MLAIAKANDNEPRGLEVAVAERTNAPGTWGVEAIDTGSEGEIYVALFSGPDAEARAKAYATFAYGLPSSPTNT